MLLFWHVDYKNSFNQSRSKVMNRTNENRVDVYQIITDRLIEIMEKGVIPWRKPWNSGGEAGPLNLISKRHYQGINYFGSSGFSVGNPCQELAG